MTDSNLPAAAASPQPCEDRDPATNPHVGDNWSWADDGRICAYVGFIDPNGDVWLYDPTDNLPQHHWEAKDFPIWAKGARFVGQGATAVATPQAKK